MLDEGKPVLDPTGAGSRQGLSCSEPGRLEGDCRTGSQSRRFIQLSAVALPAAAAGLWHLTGPHLKPARPTSCRTCFDDSIGGETHVKGSNPVMFGASKPKPSLSNPPHVRGEHCREPKQSRDLTLVLMV